MTVKTKQKPGPKPMSDKTATIWVRIPAEVDAKLPKDNKSAFIRNLIIKAVKRGQ